MVVLAHKQFHAVRMSLSSSVVESGQGVVCVVVSLSVRDHSVQISQHLAGCPTAQTVDHEQYFLVRMKLSGIRDRT